jgi:hypothetical protein
MKGDVKDKGRPDADRAAAARGRQREAEAASVPIDDAMLRDYLADALAAEQSARVEKALRDSAELRAQLENVRQNRSDGQLHTLGAIWHRSRMTCPSRQQLGSFLLDALDPELASYLTFHLEVIECPFCRANLDDLKAQSQTAVSGSAKSRQRRIFQASQPLLGEDGRN